MHNVIMDITIALAAGAAVIGLEAEGSTQKNVTILLGIAKSDGFLFPLIPAMYMIPLFALLPVS